MATRKSAVTADPGPTLPVLDGEEPWTPDEVAAVRAELETDRERLRAAIAESQQELAELMIEGSDGTGRD